MDLLLRSEDGGLPIIAEIKAPNDNNLFAALVQALTYASELTTAYQFSRLRHSFQEFADLETDQPPRCDIYLVYFHGDTPPLREEATQLAELLLNHSSGVIAQHIRRIVFLEATSVDAFELEFKHYHLSPSSRPTY